MLHFEAVWLQSRPSVLSELMAWICSNISFPGVCGQSEVRSLFRRDKRGSVRRHIPGTMLPSPSENNDVPRL